MKRPPGHDPLHRARALRHDAPEPERRLWSILRGRRLSGYKFRRQCWIGGFIVDFVCLEAKLVVEIDGDTHTGRVEYDARRTAWLEREGFRVLRFTNGDVMTSLDGVAFGIERALTLPLGTAERAPPSPPRGEAI